MNKILKQQRRKRKIRGIISGLRVNRLSVHRTSKHIVAQITDPSGMVIASASTMEKDIRASKDYSGNVASATAIGKLVAERAVAKGVSKVAFDRAGYKYHGRVKALADAARSGGIKF
jgi:large subunit ribosomal protein L18